MESPAIDDLDHQLVQALQIDGRASFSRIAEVLGVSDQTIARRYRKLLTTGGLRVLGIADDERIGQTQWIVRLTCTPDAAEPLAAALARRPDTSWIGLASGGTEVICTMHARDERARDALLFGKLQRTPRVVSVSAHLKLHAFYGGPLGWYSKADRLDPAQAAALAPPPVEAGDDPVALDTEDKALLAALAGDGRATVAELQAVIHQSGSAVRRRLDRLRRTGVLYLDVQFEPGAFGYELHTLLWLTVAPAALSAVGNALAGHREVAFAAAVTGQCNLMAVTIFRSTHDLYRYLSERVGVLDGVQHVETAPILRQVKQLTYDAHR
ncbi:AsnC family transcriptional regulator [Streptomyces sp. SL13]|uniref:AsnC family transcriptional regulator n=1 Tax=Streptantibioticus silvisoli TaxID=2705255 RepID=A0AA90H2M6_9ACTN|nr:AsnC family transcriptional regulator [Streptantibioticus silvisoli]MDI5967221.1 AsnC family transcriptional regulator [Streptantibioticus silvisoli]MDI5969848.1 AsnC family transcriptional regulator [Streptantibioticus silvisoli]